MLDDKSIILQNPLIHGLHRIDKLFFYDPSRFLTHFSFAIQYSVCGKNPFWFHLINTFIHFLNSFLVYKLLSATLSLGQFFQKSSKSTEIIPIFAAMFFLLHPVQTEAVTYIVQRSVLLACSFCLMSLLLYLKLKKHFDLRTYLLLWTVVLLGSMTKPSFITVAGFVLLYEITFFDFSRRSIKNNVRILLPFFCGALLVLLWLFLFLKYYFLATFGLSKGFYLTSLAPDTARWEYFLTQTRVIWTYIRLLFLPIGQNIDYDYALSQSVFEPKTFLAFCGFFILLYGLWLSYRKNRAVFFGLGWFFVALIPESSIFPLPDVIFEHRLYLSTIGFGFLLAFVLSQFVQNEKRFTAYSACIFISLSMMTYSRNIFWNNEFLLLKDAARKSPYKVRPHVQLAAANVEMGNMYYGKKQFNAASNYYRMAIQVNPYDEVPYINLGNISRDAGKSSDAKKFYEKAISLNPGSWQSYYVLGNMYLSEGDFKKAVEVYQKAIASNNRFADVYNTLGIALVNLKQYTAAEAHFKKAIELDPRFEMAYANLGLCYKEMGRTQDSRRYLMKSKELRGQK